MAIYCVKSNGSIETYSDSHKNNIKKSNYVLVTDDSRKADKKSDELLNPKKKR